MQQLFDLYRNTSVIKLDDRHFINDSHGLIKVKHELFKDNDGYIMFYANWCPNCQNKQAFWTHLARQLNENKEYSNQHFRIAAVDTDDPMSQKIVNRLNIHFIPKLYHVNTKGYLKEYRGQDYEPSTILGQVCREKNKLCF
ncbi:MAG: thioredoxin domain-containing protein [candidate division WOR-3 bacterium]